MKASRLSLRRVQSLLKKKESCLLNDNTLDDLYSNAEGFGARRCA